MPISKEQIAAVRTLRLTDETVRTALAGYLAAWLRERHRTRVHPREINMELENFAQGMLSRYAEVAADLINSGKHTPHADWKDN